MNAKNIARQTCACAAALACLTAIRIPAAEPNSLTDSDKKAGWKLLFDGKTTAGWRGYRQTTMPAKGWRVEDGILKKIAGEHGGDIITDEKFNDFDLTWEWRISPAGNNRRGRTKPNSRLTFSGPFPGRQVVGVAVSSSTSGRYVPSRLIVTVPGRATLGPWATLNASGTEKWANKSAS